MSNKKNHGCEFEKETGDAIKTIRVLLAGDKDKAYMLIQKDKERITKKIKQWWLNSLIKG